MASSQLDEKEVLAAQAQLAAPQQAEKDTPQQRQQQQQQHQNEKPRHAPPPIPQTSKARLQAAADEQALDIDALVHSSSSSSKAVADGAGAWGASAEALSKSQETILYLAYGSNLSSQTFRERRRIDPISQTSVFVPDLALTFDLPGVPYLEPCFAGTQFHETTTTTNTERYRDHDEPLDGEDDDGDGTTNSMAAAGTATAPTNTMANGSVKEALLPAPKSRPNIDSNGNGMIWDKPLVGVVYEVTLADYARIIATEGGGASYIDVAVSCHPFPADYDPEAPVPDHPPTPAFKAHTLLSPAGSRQPSSHLSRPPYYAQPSARYKNLLVTGAREHDLPADYRRYLAALPSYHITSIRQRVGMVVFVATWAPFLLLAMAVARALSDGRGRSPPFVAWLQKALFEGMWWSYDTVFRKVAGEGERTVE